MVLTSCGDLIDVGGIPHGDPADEGRGPGGRELVPSPNRILYLYDDNPHAYTLAISLLRDLDHPQ